MALAIIGGTGVYDLGAETEARIVPTPYGETAVYSLEIAGKPVLFLPRHGVGHSVPPHRINYRANIWALHQLGVREVLATQAVGSLNLRMPPGNFVILSQFIDWTKNRPFTFFDGDDGQVIHTDMTNPYCPLLSGILLHAGEFLNDRLRTDAVYACLEGPRFETAAEIRALRTLGADVVGMTNVPEVVLAREAGLCYVAVSIVCNWAAGMTTFPLTMQEVLDIMQDTRDSLQELIQRFINLKEDAPCSCEGLGFGALLRSS
ncbi:MAG: S-methyl-5'-thioinosine phosphorylase [Armatimonadota bacterium]